MIPASRSHKSKRNIDSAEKIKIDPAVKATTATITIQVKLDQAQEGLKMFEINPSKIVLKLPIILKQLIKLIIINLKLFKREHRKYKPSEVWLLLVPKTTLIIMEFTTQRNSLKKRCLIPLKSTVPRVGVNLMNQLVRFPRNYLRPK